MEQPEQNLAGIAVLRQQLNTSMQIQETLAKNVNDGLLENRSLRQQLEQVTQERDEFKYRQQVIADTVGEENWSLRTQLTAMTDRHNEEVAWAKASVSHLAELKAAARVVCARYRTNMTKENYWLDPVIGTLEAALKKAQP